MTRDPVYAQFRDHRAASAYDRFSDEYDARYHAPLDRAEDRYVQDALRGLVLPDERVVDLGCGTGLLLDMLYLESEQYVGVDISRKMLDVAGRKWPVHRNDGCFRLADMTATGLEGGSVDIAICLFGGVSYNASLSLLDEVDRLLAPAGRFFLMFLGEGALTCPSEILAATEGLWVACAYDTLKASFEITFDDVRVAPLTGPVAREMAHGAYPPIAASDQDWRTLLLAEQRFLLDSGNADLAYWQIVTGRKRA